ncbi:MAG: plastocyanin/azurin family copper-binding protein [Actinomycetota bacterium]|nr:plastocyanin/azurin family copper-binding protein [Actinomycetota bacterium]
MNELFYVLGGVLVLMAVVLSFLGLRSENFPGSRGALAGGLTLMTVIVLGTCAWAIGLAREEADHRSHEFEEFFAEQEAEEATEEEEPVAPAERAEEEPVDTEPSKDAIEVTSPEAGDLIFNPDSLEAAAGEVALAYTNPSPVPHNIAIENDGKALAESETVTEGDSATATANLDAGTYVFYCAVPGHRESGMQGELTVE